MSINNWYLGAQGVPGGMQRLPQVTNNPVTAPRGRTRQVTVTADGGSTVIAQLHAKSPVNLAWAYLTETEADLIDSFADGLFGDGPFVLVNPLRRNVLGFDDSTMGLRSNAPIRWAVSGGSFTRTAANGPLSTTGVLNWAPTNGAVLALTSANGVDVNSAPAYVPGEAVTGSVYVKAASAVGATLQLGGYDSTGTLIGSPLSRAVNVTTAWQRVNVTAVAGYFGSAAFISPRLVSGGTTALTVAAVQVEYGQLSDWQRGYGSPRVIISEDPGHSVEQLGYADKTLVLAQC